jgi:two-component system, OmpR family, response regulator CpxR
VAPNRILLIDDDADLCALMADFFAENGFEVEFASDGRAGLARALTEPFELVILDVMLPFLDGFQVLEQIRRRSAVPIIMLTARIEERDRVAGLNAGADDYLPKPFGPEELLARIRAVLRRAGGSQVVTAPLECGSVRLDPQTREVWQNGDPLELTSIEFEILEHLMRSAGRVVSRDEFTTILYQRQSTPFERALDVHISHLRKKLESDSRPLIHTVRGVGYQMAASK